MYFNIVKGIEKYLRHGSKQNLHRRQLRKLLGLSLIS